MPSGLNVLRLGGQATLSTWHAAIIVLGLRDWIVGYGDGDVGGGVWIAVWR